MRRPPSFGRALIASLALLPIVIASLNAQTPTFQQTKITVGCNPTHVLSSDFNGDQISDLAFTCRTGSSSPFTVLLGKGDGTFQNPISPTTPAFADTGVITNNPLVAADFDRDGKTDLAYIAANGDLVVLLSTGNGTFRSVQTTPANARQVLVAAADMNGDGRPDLVLFTGLHDSFAAIALGKGDGTFSVPSAISVTTSSPPFEAFSPIFLVLGDFNGDRLPDLLVYGAAANPGSLPLAAIFSAYSQPGGTYSSRLEKEAAPPIATGDFDGDGNLDYADTTFLGTSLDIYYGDGHGNSSNIPGFSGPFFDGPFAAGDLNGDGRADLAMAAASANSLRIVISNPGRTFQSVAFLDLGASPTDVLIADLNGDGKPDVVTANTSNASILINTTAIVGVSSALNGASFAVSQPVAPGSLVSVFGTGLASSDAQAPAIPLPLSLGNVSVTVAGMPAPLLFVSSKQINLQIPWTVPTGNADIVVTVNGTPLKTFRVTVSGVAPGIFSTQFGTGQAIAINSDGSLTAPAGSIPGIATHPANPGDTIIVLATGLGAVSPSIRAGEASTDALRNTVTVPNMLIGGAPASVSFSGLAPQFVGVNQLNVVVPSVPAGVVSIQIDVNGSRTTDKVTIAVANP